MEKNKIELCNQGEHRDIRTYLELDISPSINVVNCGNTVKLY